MKYLPFERVLQEGAHLKPFDMRLSGQPLFQHNVWQDPSGGCHLVPSQPQSKAEEIKFLVQLVRMFVEGRVHTCFDVGTKVCSIKM